MVDFSKLILRQHRKWQPISAGAIIGCNLCAYVSLISSYDSQRYQHLIFLVSAKQSKRSNCEILMDGNGTNKTGKNAYVQQTHTSLETNQNMN